MLSGVGRDLGESNLQPTDQESAPPRPGDLCLLCLLWPWAIASSAAS